MRNPLCPGSVACNKPKMRDKNGRTWDQCDVILSDGTKIVGYLDTSWGHYFYFQLEGAWRKGKMDTFDKPTQGFINIFEFPQQKKA